MTRLLSRRAAGRAAFALAAAAWSPHAIARESDWRRPGPIRFLDHPFKLGVASGDPVADGFVIWTRLAPDPLHATGGMPDEAVPVAWEVAEDPAFRRLAARGRTLARPAVGHSVHVEVMGLRPARSYWYRFIAGTESSPVGRTRTAPVIGAATERLRFGFASCAHYEQGYFSAYRAMERDELDLVIHLGDYFYESSWGRPVRRHPGPEPVDLDGYRIYHSLYKMDPDLQGLHMTTPWLATWDDHEVENDYADEMSENLDPTDAFLRRRAAAYQAYWEHMPLRLRQLPAGPDMRLYIGHAHGDLIDFSLLDNRQYRDDHPCEITGDYGGRLAFGCDDRGRPERSMLGEEQERWLLGRLGRLPATWNVLAQAMLFVPFHQTDRDGNHPAYWTDGWDAFPANRQRILNRLVERQVANPVVIGGDIHSFWVTDVHAEAHDDRSPVIASEFVCTSITSAGPPHEVFASQLKDNPHVRFFQSGLHGYVRCTVDHDLWRSDLVTVDNVADPGSEAAIRTSFVVEAGKPGPVAA